MRSGGANSVKVLFGTSALFVDARGHFDVSTMIYSTPYNIVLVRRFVLWINFYIFLTAESSV